MNHFIKDRLVITLGFALLWVGASACGDGRRVDRLVQYACTETGQWDLVEIDEENDGKVDERRTRNYSSENAYVEEWDEDMDGQADRRSSSERIGDVRRTEYDGDADGVVDYIWTIQHDTEGRIQTVLLDDDADGIPDRRTDYLYSEDGTELVIEHDADLDGTPDEGMSVDLGDCGWLFVEVETGGNQAIQFTTEYQYDPSCDLLAVLTDNDSDGEADHRVSYDYRGSSIFLEHASLTDGQFDPYEVVRFDKLTDSCTNQLPVTD